MKNKALKIIVLLITTLSTPVWACDLCAIYVANHAEERSDLALDVGVFESFTHFGTLQQDGNEIANPLGQYMSSSTTQVFVNYSPLEHLAIQINAPFIVRNFKRAEHGVAESGSEVGLGDISIIGNFLAIEMLKPESSFDLHLLGGIKLPTGSTHRLHEELHEHEDEEGEVESGVHGHDLTLGSGSVDGVLGLGAHGNWRRFLFSGNAQYNIRSRGSIDYRFANDLQGNIAPGYYILLNHSYTIALQARLSGEYKKTDDLAGVTADDTGITSLFVGPNAIFTWSSNFNLNAGLDLPIMMRNTALQSVPDYRIRAAITYNF